MTISSHKCTSFYDRLQGIVLFMVLLPYNMLELMSVDKENPSRVHTIQHQMLRIQLVYPAVYPVGARLDNKEPLRLRLR